MKQNGHDFAAQGLHDQAIDFFAGEILAGSGPLKSNLLSLAGSLVFERRLIEALSVYVVLANVFPDTNLDYFELKNRLRTHFYRNSNAKLLNTALKMVRAIVRNSTHKAGALDMLSDLLLVKGDTQLAQKKKQKAANLNACHVKKITGGDAVHLSGGRLPDFIVMGPQKSGTTALYDYLLQSKQVLPAIKKELFFFNTSMYRQGLEWYASHFPDIAGFDYVTGEATATYFNNPSCYPKIFSSLKDIKIIITLRDPSSRAISDYYMKVRNGLEDRSLSDALLSEVQFLSNRNLDVADVPKDYWEGGHKGYVMYGLYAHYLERLHQHVDKENVLIIDTARLRSNKADTINAVSGFLGLDAYALLDDKNKNVGKYEKDEEYHAVKGELEKFYGQSKNVLESDGFWQ